jgi:formate dehydrogenase subunit beta
MSKLLKIDKGVEEGTRDLLEFLLRENRVRGVMTLKKGNAGQGVTYSLITRPDELKDALPLYPLMPANAGKILSHLTLRGPMTEPVAAVVKPCELRAFVELVKREQGSLDNFLIISPTCPGVFPLETSVKGGVEDLVSEYWNQTQSADVIPDTRPACRSCLHFVPDSADLIVSLIGEKDLDNKCRIFVNSEKGRELVNGIKAEIQEQELENQGIELLRNKRAEERTRLFEQMETETQGITGLVQLFGKCIGCHGCSHVCPICYCDLCFFDSQQNESSSLVYESDLERNGAARIPAGTIYFHLGRLAHISVSCTGCGMCSDVCPVNIPVSTVFSKVGEAVQKSFDYSPGLDLEEPVPFSTYKEEEFTEIGEQ